MKKKDKMIKREACFACTTPYQVLSSIAVQKDRKLDADLYVFGMFENYRSVCEKISAYGLFANVIPVDCSQIGAPSKKEAFKQMLWSRTYTKVFLEDRTVYNVFFTSSRAHPKLLLLHELGRRNKNLRIVMIEDGLGTYTPISTQLRTQSKQRRLLNTLLGWGEMFPPDKTTVMSRRPDLIELPSDLSKALVLQMPELPTDENTTKMLFDIFGVSVSDTIKERVVIFDTVRGLKNIGIQFDVINQCYQLLLNVFSIDNVVCKSHPRSRKTTSVPLKLYDKPYVPVEVLYSGMEDIEDRVLVGICSTAMYSPKLIFGKEPYVIDLHKIAFGEEKKVYSELCNKMRSLYQDSQKVFCPETLEDLLEIINKLV